MKIKTLYVCQSCGASSPKWLGRCNGCGEWNSLVEERQNSGPSATAAAAQESGLTTVREEFRGLLDDVGATGALMTGGASPWVPLEGGEEDEDSSPESGSRKSTKQTHRRILTGIRELDRVLGGGMVPDSFTLVGGDPGIGKSTLLLQMMQGLLQGTPSLRLLYVSGEESIDQIRGRARRLGVRSQGQVFLAAETQLERVFATVKEIRPHVIVMDSLQTFSSGYLQSAPGSVGQLREVTSRLMALAKSAGIAVWLVGHVTKDGNIAGPKVVEHMVDTVLYFEGEGSHSYRLLRTVKNRFGSSRELGVFEMDSEGLKEVENPSALFLSDRKVGAVGTAVAASLEGSRPLLVELQALVAPSGLAMPRRTAVGMDASRISLLAAILERHMHLKLAQQDLFFNVAGGLRLSEPACDLAAAAAIWSSFEDFAIPADWAIIGELGLTGEVRRVPHWDVRLEEVAKLGFKRVVLPRAVLTSRSPSVSGVEIYPIDRVQELPGILQGAPGAVFSKKSPKPPHTTESVIHL